MSSDTPLTPVQARLKEAAIAMDFAEEDVLLALRQLPAADASLDEDAAAFKRCKMKVCGNCLAAWQADVPKPCVECTVALVT